MKRLIEFLACKLHRLMQGWWRAQGGETARIAALADGGLGWVRNQWSLTLLITVACPPKGD